MVNILVPLYTFLAKFVDDLEGCSIHWKYVRKLADKQLTPCSECGKLTRSVSERCPAYIKGFYVS